MDPEAPDKQPASTQDGPTRFFRAASLASLGIELAVSIIIGWFAGQWADGKLGTQPWLMLVGTLLGVGAGFKALLRVNRQFHRDEAESRLRESKQRQHEDHTS